MSLVTDLKSPDSRVRALAKALHLADNSHTHDRVHCLRSDRGDRGCRDDWRHRIRHQVLYLLRPRARLEPRSVISGGLRKGNDEKVPRCRTNTSATGLTLT